MAKKKAYLTTAEVAEVYGCNKMYLYRQRDKGLLTAYRFINSKYTYWKASELDRLAKQQPIGEPTARWQREIIEDDEKPERN